MLMAFGFPGHKTNRPAQNPLRLLQWKLTDYTSYTYENNDWFPDIRMEYYYIANNSTKLDKVVVQDWDEVEWSPYKSLVQYSYNVNGRVVEQLISMEFMGDIFDYGKASYEYDSQNRLLKATMKVFDEWDQVWTPIFRYDMVYGSGTSFTAYQWNPYDDDEYYRAEYEFDSFGRIIQENIFASDDSLNWENNSRTFTQYHPQDSHTGADLIEYIADMFHLMLLLDSYEFPGMKSVVTHDFWDENMWLYAGIIECEYDTQLRLEWVNEDFYHGTNWLSSYTDDYFYDSDGQNNLVIGKIFLDGMDDFELDEKHEYGWESFEVANDDNTLPPARLAIEAYPSPFTDRLNIKTGAASSAPLTVSVYNLKGQLLHSFESSDGREIVWDGSDQPSGIYFIRASQGTESSVKKVLKLK
jgi:hypothetical protein